MTIIICLSSVPHVVWGQTSVAYFQAAFDHQSKDELGVFIAGTSQGYLTSGQSLEFSVDNDIIISGEVNYQGDSLWKKTYRKPGTNLYPHGGINEQNGFLLYGEAIDTGKNNDEVMLAKFNNQANIQWYQQFGVDNGQSVTISKVKPLPSGGYVLIGFIMQGGGPKTLYGQVDSQGNLLYQDIHINFQNANNNRPKCIVPMANGNYLYGGARNYLNTNAHPNYTKYTQPFLTKIDSSGTILWDENLHVPDSNGQGKIMDIVATYDGHYLLMGYRDYPPDFADTIPSMAYGWVRKVDSAGHVIWEHDYKPSFANGCIFRFGRQLADSSFVLIGGMSHKDNNRSNGGWMMKISQEGDSIWSRSHRHPASQTSRYLTWYHFVPAANDNGFVLTGSGNGLYGDPYDQDMIVMKVDSAGCIWPGCTPPQDDTATDTTFIASTTTGSTNVSVRPNPFSHQATIQLQTRQHLQEAPLLQLYNLQGRQVKTLRPRSTSLAKDRSTFRLRKRGLSSGMYFYRIRVEGRSVASGKVVVE